MKIPRLVIAGTGGDSGKTLITLGIIAAFKVAGLDVRAFKKGPDYIDSAWLGSASGQVMARNLDPYLMPERELKKAFARSADGADLVIVEGNRGLCDGMTPEGDFSTAKLARLIEAPVVLVLPVQKVTRTAAAMVLGLKQMEPDLDLAGVVLNRVAGKRHESVVREVIESVTGIPVIGAVPKSRKVMLPDRHLGLVTPEDHHGPAEAIDSAVDLLRQRLDLDMLRSIASSAPPFDVEVARDRDVTDRWSGRPRIGVFKDRAFSFYYPENLEALERQGLELTFISPLDGDSLPKDLCGLYIGGGFPEVHAWRLSANKDLMNSVRMAVAKGLPVYAECGGLIFLSSSLNYNGRTYEMSRVLPVSVKVDERPKGHGYVSAVVDGDNPFFEKRVTLKGHEFHYSWLSSGRDHVKTALKLDKGKGIGGGRDGIVVKNVFASYTHLHAIGCPQWAEGFASAVKRFAGIGN